MEKRIWEMEQIKGGKPNYYFDMKIEKLREQIDAINQNPDFDDRKEEA